MRPKGGAGDTHDHRVSCVDDQEMVRNGFPYDMVLDAQADMSVAVEAGGRTLARTQWLRFRGGRVVVMDVRDAQARRRRGRPADMPGR